MTDIIASPAHYNMNGRETIDIIWDCMSEAEFEGYLKGNILKYLTRYKYKYELSPEQDLKKARWYLDKLIETVEKK